MTRLAVEDSGGDGPSIVLVHGLSSNLRIWAPLVDRLRDRYRCVAYDQRNHGQSFDDPDVSYAALASDLESLGVHDPFVVGHSWGASVALEYALTRPVRGLICVDGAIVDLQDMGIPWEQVEVQLRPPEIEFRADALDAMSPERRAVLLRSFPPDSHGVMRRTRPPMDVHMAIVRTIWAEPTLTKWRDLNTPAMVVAAADESPYIDAKRAGAAKLPARVEWVTSGHDIPIERPDELASLIAEFVEQQAGHGAC